MNCKTCGTTLADSDKFCPVCGTKVEVISQPVAEDVHPVQEEKSVNQTEVQENKTPVVEETILEQSSKEFYEPAEKIESQEVRFDVKHNLLAVLGGIAAIVGCFFSFANVEASFLGYGQKIPVSYIDNGGFLVIGAVVIGIILTCLQKDKVALIPTFIAIGITAYDAINVSQVMSDPSVSMYSSYMDLNVSLGIGFYIIAIGLIVMIFGIFANLNAKNTD